MKKLELIIKRWRLFITPTVATVISLMMIILVVVPRFQKSREISQLIDQNQEKLSRLSTKLADLGGINEKLLEEKTGYSLQALPGSKDVMKILSVFNGLSQATGVVFEEIGVSPGEVATSPAIIDNFDLELLSFKLKLSATSEGMLDFFEKIERSLPLLNLLSFRIDNSGLYSEAETLLVNYFSKIPLSLGELDSPLIKPGPADELNFEKIKEMVNYEAPLLGIPVATGSSSFRTDPFSN